MCDIENIKKNNFLEHMTETRRHFELHYRKGGCILVSDRK